MTALRALGSVAIAWAAWIIGHSLIAWKGLDHLRSVMMRAEWSSVGIIGLLSIVIGACLLAAATLSLLLSWVGLLSVGVVQILVAVATGFFWSRELIADLMPSALFTSMYSQHLYLGVHLALGAIAVGLALATLLRPRSGARGVGPRLISLVAVPCTLAAVVVLAFGGGRNLRSLQTFLSADALAVVLVLLAGVLLAVSALLAAASGTGPAVGGVLVLMVGAIALLTPDSFFTAGMSEFSTGWFYLAASGALFVLGMVLTVGAAAVSIAARLGGTARADDRSAIHPGYPSTHQEF